MTAPNDSTKNCGDTARSRIRMTDFSCVALMAVIAIGSADMTAHAVEQTDQSASPAAIQYKAVTYEQVKAFAIRSAFAGALSTSDLPERIAPNQVKIVKIKAGEARIAMEGFPLCSQQWFWPCRGRWFWKVEVPTTTVWVDNVPRNRLVTLTVMQDRNKPSDLFLDTVSIARSPILDTSSD